MPSRFQAGVRFSVVITLAVGLALGQSRPNASPQNSTIKVDVDLTLVNATVVDPESRIVTGLEARNFQVWEDKVEQKIEYFSREDSPISLGIIFDVSGSMKERISASRDAAATFLKMSNPQDEYFLIEFSSEPRITEDFTSDISKLQNRLTFTSIKGKTAMYDAIYLGLEKLKHGANPRKALLLITDGEDNHSRYSASDIKELIKERDVQIYAIGILGFEFGKGHPRRTAIEELSEISGGQALFPNSVDELEDISVKIGAELKNQYILGYRSTNESQDGKWRRIRVKVHPPARLPHVTVRAKSGYYAPALESSSFGRTPAELELSTPNF
jgi:Ca-activated chloride channel family protein